MAKEGGGYYNLDDFAGLRGQNRWEERDEKGALVVRGYASHLFDNPNLARELHLEKHLIRVGAVATDEYDVRTLLAELHERDEVVHGSDFGFDVDAVAEYVESSEDVALQPGLDQERYVDLPKSAEASGEEAWRPSQSLVETLPASVTELPKTEKQFLLLQHTARSIAVKPKLEALIVARQNTSDEFSFLRAGHRLNPLYEHLKLRFITARAKTSKRETKSRWGGEGSSTASRNKEALAQPTPERHMAESESSDQLAVATKDPKQGKLSREANQSSRKTRSNYRRRSSSRRGGYRSRRDCNRSRHRRRRRSRSTSSSRSRLRSISRSRSYSRSRYSRRTSRRYSRSRSTRKPSPRRRSRSTSVSRRRHCRSHSASSSRERDKLRRRSRRRSRRSHGSSSSRS